jgi:hypothetical protein
MTNQVSLDVLGQMSPRGSELDNDTPPSDIAAVSVRPVQQSIVDQRGVSRFHGERYLTTQIPHRRVCGCQTFSGVGIRVWKQGMNGRSPLDEIRAGPDVRHSAVWSLTGSRGLQFAQPLADSSLCDPSTTNPGATTGPDCATP